LNLNLWELLLQGPCTSQTSKNATAVMLFFHTSVNKIRAIPVMPPRAQRKNQSVVYLALFMSPFQMVLLVLLVLLVLALVLMVLLVLLVLLASSKSPSPSTSSLTLLRRWDSP
jgi:hypothetical protein